MFYALQHDEATPRGKELHSLAFAKSLAKAHVEGGAMAGADIASAMIDRMAID